MFDTGNKLFNTLPLMLKLPTNTLAVVVMLAVELIALTTFELKLNPAAFRLPLVILPVVDTGLLPNAAKLATTLALP